MRKQFQKAVVIWLIIMLLFGSAPVSALGAPQASNQSIMINVSILDGDNIYYWDFPYNDRFFLEDDSVYQHELCQSSLGIVAAAIRDVSMPLGEQEHRLVDFYETAGFENIRIYGYDQSPHEYSISNGIASKKINDTTLIAIAVCGEKYASEWVSNVTMGTLEDHEGFSVASETVQERLYKYMHDNRISGKVKVWIAGYSRSAAVSNLVAADLTESGEFAGVYAYCFATPGNTKKPEKHDNIFNIIGKTDLVPMAPIADWGYDRHGQVLYTPTPEYDSDYGIKRERANLVYQKLTGRTMNYNPIINDYIYTAFAYLYELFPSSPEYVKYLESSLQDVIRGKDTDGALNVLTKSIEEMITSGPKEKEKKAAEFLDFLLRFGAVFTSGNKDEVFGEYWDNQVDVSGNLWKEHLLYTYLSWVFSSDNPDEIYSSNVDNLHLVIGGNVTVRVYDADGLVQTIDSNGNTTPAPGKTVYQQMYYTRSNDATFLVVPKDISHEVCITLEKDGKMTCFLSSRQGRSFVTKTSETVKVNGNKGNTYRILLPSLTETTDDSYLLLQEVSGDVVATIDMSADKYSPTDVVLLENRSISTLSLEKIRQFAAVGIGLLALFVLLFLIGIIRTRLLKRGNHNGLMLAEYACITVFFTLLQELSLVYLTAYPSITDTFGLLATLTGAVLLVRAIGVQYPELKKIAAFTVICYLIGDVFYNDGLMYPAYGCYIVGMLAMALAICRYVKPTVAHVVIWALLSMASAVVYYQTMDASNTWFILMVCYMAVYYAEYLMIFRFSKQLFLISIITTVDDLSLLATTFLGVSPLREVMFRCVWCFLLFVVCGLVFYQARKMGNRKETCK